MQIKLNNLKNFKKGLKELTPSQLSSGKIAGLWGMLIGLVVVFFEMVIAKKVGWSIFIFAFAIVQAFQLKGELQSYKNLKRFEQQIKSTDFDKEVEELEKEMIPNE